MTASDMQRLPNGAMDGQLQRTQIKQLTNQWTACSVDNPAVLMLQWTIGRLWRTVYWCCCRYYMTMTSWPPLVILLLPLSCTTCSSWHYFVFCNRELVGSNLSLGYFAPRSTEPSIPPGSVNKYQLRLGMQRQVWLIPIADERVGVQVNASYLSASAVVFHYDETLYQVYAPLPLPYYYYTKVRFFHHQSNFNQLDRRSTW